MMSDFEKPIGFQDCWTPRKPRAVRSKAAGYFSVGQRRKGDGGDNDAQRQSGGRQALSAADKATLARVVRGAPEVMVKVTKPAKVGKDGKQIVVNQRTESVRVAAHIDYISRNGKIELETSDGELISGKEAASAFSQEWLISHDEDRKNGFASDRTRITTSMVMSMPAKVNAEAVKDAVRSLAEEEFGGRHDYVMALHTDTKHPHVHLTVRTVGHDGVRLNLRKADLQHLRDQFAERLRQRGIEAEATPRHARGVTKKSERMAVYKVRRKPDRTVRTDEAKRAEVDRDLNAHGGRLPDYPWDRALYSRRNRVINTYMKAATALARSDDPDDQAIARDTERFLGRMTSLTTERARMASEASQERVGGDTGVIERDGPGRGRDGAEKRLRDTDRDKSDRER